MDLVKGFTHHLHFSLQAMHPTTREAISAVDTQLQKQPPVHQPGLKPH
jgi:hypothetical protein